PVQYLQGGCGPTSLQAVCRQCGVSATMDDIGRISGGDSPISSLAELQSGARALGLKAEGLEMSIAQLRRTRPLGVLHIGGGHFVAVIGYASVGPRIADPVAPGKVSVSLWPYDQVSARWGGRIL